MNFRAITWQHVTREFRTLAFNYATFYMQTMHCTRLIISQYQKRLREQAMNYRVEHPVFSVRHHHVVRVRVETVTRSRSFCDARLSRTSLMLRAGVSRERY